VCGGILAGRAAGRLGGFCVGASGGCGVVLGVLGERWETVGRTERFSHNSVGGWGMRAP